MAIAGEDIFDDDDDNGHDDDGYNVDVENSFPELRAVDWVM